MDIIEKLLEIALKAYIGKKDKAGKTYILHPLRIMAKMTTEKEMAIALLHDVIEDSDFTAEDLLNDNIPSDVVEAVQCLTKENGESYEEFVIRVAKNKLAAKIKKADIEDNINVLRLSAVEDKDLERIVKYHKAWHYLNENG